MSEDKTVKQAGGKALNTVYLKIRLDADESAPDNNGLRLFKAVLPNLGTQSPDIWARTAQGAVCVLERLIQNGLDDRDGEWVSNETDEGDPGQQEETDGKEEKGN